MHSSEGKKLERACGPAHSGAVEPQPFRKPLSDWAVTHWFFDCESEVFERSEIR